MTHPSDPASPHPERTPAPAPDAAPGSEAPASADAPGDAPAADGPRDAGSGGDGSAGRAPEAEDPFTPEGTVILVRRRRMPSLGFWVLGCMLLAALVGAVVAYVVDVRYLAGMVYFAVTSAVFFGLPLAALAALVDALRHRRSDRRR